MNNTMIKLMRQWLFFMRKIGELNFQKNSYKMLLVNMIEK